MSLFAPLILGATLKVRRDLLSDDDLRRLKQAHTLRTDMPDMGGYGGPKILLAYKDSPGKYIEIPRQSDMALDLMSRYDVLEGCTDGEPITAQWTGTFREGQRDFVLDSLRGLRRNRDGMSIAGCGFGKTVTATAIACAMGRTTLIGVHKKKLMDQWQKAFKDFCHIDVGIVQGSRIEFEDKQVVVAMIQTLASPGFEPPGGFLTWPGLTIWDECLTGDVLVTTDKGDVPLSDIPSAGAKSVLSFDDTSGAWSWKEIVRWVPKGRQATVAVRTTDAEIRCTEDHLIHTQDGWVEAGKLLPGMRILSPARVDAQSRSQPSGLTENLGNTCSDIRTKAGPSTESLAGRDSRQRLPNAGAGAANGFVSPRVSRKRGYGNLSGANTCPAITGHAGGDRYRKKRSGCSMGRFSAMPLSYVLTQERLRGCVGTTAPNRQGGPLTKQSGCGDWGSKSGTLPTEVTVSGSVKGVVCATQDLKKYSAESVSPRKFLENGSIPSQKKVLLGGIKTTDQLDAGASLSTQKVTHERDLNSSPEFSVRGVGLRREPSELGNTGSYGSEQTTPSGGSMLTVNSRDPEWATSSSEVVSVKPTGVTEQVYDIEVEGNHNFVANGLLVHNCHRMSAPTFADAITAFPSKYRLGLTATPRRGDKMEDVFYWHLGDIHARGLGEFLDCKVWAIRTGFELPESAYYFRGKPHMAKLLSALCEIPERNAMLVRICTRAAKAGRRVLLLSHRVKHCKLIADTLNEQFKAMGLPYTAGHLGAGSSKKASKMQDAAAACTVTTSTWPMAAEGLDIPDKDSLVVATPCSDVEQAAGRIRRLFEGKKFPHIYDLVDNMGPCWGQWGRRRNFYVSSKDDKQPWEVNMVGQ